MNENSPYVCSHCKAGALKWAVACGACGRSDTIVAQDPRTADREITNTPIGATIRRPAVHALGDIKDSSDTHIDTGIRALDDCLGGGFVRSAVTLVAGPPGIGKSTLLLQALADIAHTHRVMMISGEEPLPRLAGRARRLKLNVNRVSVFAHTDFQTIAKAVRLARPAFLVVDSLQTIANDELRARAGTPTQLVTCTKGFVSLAQSLNIAVAIVGHVAKDNKAAGPRTVEHLIDVMLYFNAKGEQRVLHCAKNRFGPALENHFLKMTATGLIDVKRP